MSGLFEAKKRYGLSILNYAVTSNHIHLLVVDKPGRNVIPDSIKLIAGRTGQEYNQRKKRKGAYWEDRYHATAIQTGEHLARCLTYIDLNMVRAGAVKHPKDWEHGGYNEIQNPKKRYRIIDHQELMQLFCVLDVIDFASIHRKWVEEALAGERHKRQSRWTESVAVGDESFVKDLKDGLIGRVRGRQVVESEGNFELREQQVAYHCNMGNDWNLIECLNCYFRG